MQNKNKNTINQTIPPMLIGANLEILEKLTLGSGSHSGPDEGFCVMEAVAYIAGEPFSDHPVCACPVITSFLVTWNDGLPDNATRDRLLKPLIPQIVGTRSTPEVERARRELAWRWLTQTYLPAWLDLAGLTVQAEALRADPTDQAIFEARDAAQAAWATTRDAAWAAAMDTAMDTARDTARAAAMAAARDTARAATRDAAMAAARDAAMDAARDTAWAAAMAAARSAARDAAMDAARAAARATAWAAARSAARSAARDFLSPVTEKLQLSAVELVRAMIAVTD